MKILIIDNYDSFTYNLVQLLGKSGHELIIRRNDELSAEDIDLINPDKILISPGPGRPESSCSSIDAIKYFGEQKPILGVCLGHQAIGISYGAKVVKAPVLMHGKTSIINHDEKTIYRGLPQNFIATRYHSLVIDEQSIPDELEISSYSEDGIVMGVRHRNFPVEGIQFHPESILTVQGENLINNWLKL